MSANEIRNGIIASLVMIAIAGGFVLTGVLTSINMKKVGETYATTQAMVMNISQRNNNTESGLTPRSEVTTTYRVDLEYTVDGITYKIRRKVRWDLESGTTTVYYNQDNPKKVYVEEQVMGRYFTSWYLIAGIVGGLGLAVLIFVLTQRGKPVK